MALPIPGRQPERKEPGVATALPSILPEVPVAPAKPARKSRKAARPAPEPAREQGPYRTDKKTGVQYKVLPKTEWSGDDGFSVVHMTDEELANPFSGESMDHAAEIFLGHLRVAPSKQERVQLAVERERQHRSSEEQYQRNLARMKELAKERRKAKRAKLTD